MDEGVAVRGEVDADPGRERLPPGEAVLQLGAAGVGVLDHLVQEPGGHHDIAEAGLLEQIGHLDRMHDRGLAVGVAALPRVPVASELAGFAR